MHTQQTAHITLGCIDDTFTLWHWVVVNHTWHDATAGVVAHKIGGTAGGNGIECDWHSPREALAGLTVQLQFLRSTPVVDASKCGCFEQHVSRALMNFRISATHDTTDGNGIKR